MKTVIIEDEDLTAEDLFHTLQRVDPSISLEKRLSHVSEAIRYFKNGTDADLIFSDIQLGDGQSFEIFQAIPPQIPIVFCTAYDHYMQEAFQNFGLDYILKPFSEESIRNTLKKYKQLKHTFNKDTLKLLERLRPQVEDKSQQRSIIVVHSDRIIPIQLTDIELCYIEYENVFAKVKSGEQYILHKSLDEMESLLGKGYFRVNRQHILKKEIIAYASYGLGRKLVLQLHTKHTAKITVSKERANLFLQWLEH